MTLISEFLGKSASATGMADLMQQLVTQCEGLLAVTGGALVPKNVSGTCWTSRMYAVPENMGCVQILWLPCR